MKKIIFIFLLLIFFLPHQTLGEEVKKKAFYFFSDTCEHCQNVEDFLQTSGAYQKYEIQKLDTHQSENVQKLNALFEAFGVEEKRRGLPAIFFDRKLLVGDVKIIKNFSQMIDEVPANFFPTAEIIKELAEKEREEVLKQRKYSAEISVKTIFLSSVSDFLNPTSLLVFLFLIWLLFLTGTRKKIVFSGLIFISAIFLSRLFLAIFFYNFPGKLDWWNYPVKILAILNFIFGILIIRDFFIHRQVRIFENKNFYFFLIRWRRFIEKIKGNILNRKKFFLWGVLTSLLLWVHPNDSYRALMETLKIENNLLKTSGVILAVNLLFLLPFFAFVGLMWEFNRTKKLAIFGEKMFNLVKILLGVIMLFAGFYLFWL